MPSLTTHNTPALRFPGYTGVWEQQRFHELALVRRGLTYKPSDVHASGIRVLRSSNIVDETFTTSPDDIFVQDNAINIPFIHNGDILVTAANGSSRLVGKHAIVRNLLKNSAVPGGFMLCLSSPEPDFLNASMSSSWYSKFIHVFVAGGNGSIGNISKSSLDMQPVLVPSLPEQQKIGSFFRHLDGLINLHQRQTQKLKKLKQGLLHEMFPREGESVPRLRFPGFTTNWEQQRLGNITNRITRKNTHLESDIPLTLSAQYGLIDQNEFFTKRIASKDISGYYLVRNGEFAYNKSTSSDAPWGAIERLDRYDQGVLSTLYIVFGVKDPQEINSDYLVSYYQTNLWHRGIQAIASEGARNHGLLNITPADFFDTTISVPSDYREQSLIGSFFRKLDDLLALHEQYTVKLTHLKKGLLQKMFPQD